MDQLEQLSSQFSSLSIPMDTQEQEEVMLFNQPELPNFPSHTNYCGLDGAHTICQGCQAEKAAEIITAERKKVFDLELRIGGFHDSALQWCMVGTELLKAVETSLDGYLEMVREGKNETSVAELSRSKEPLTQILALTRGDSLGIQRCLDWAVYWQQREIAEKLYRQLDPGFPFDSLQKLSYRMGKALFI